MFKKELLTWSKKVPLVIGEYRCYILSERSVNFGGFSRTGSLIFIDGIVVKIFVPIGCYDCHAHPRSTFSEQRCQHFAPTSDHFHDKFLALSNIGRTGGDSFLSPRSCCLSSITAFGDDVVVDRAIV